MKKQSILKGLLAPALLGLACNANASLLIGGDAVNQASATSILDIVFAIDKEFGIKVPVEKWTQDVNAGTAPAEQYFVMKNLATRVEELVAAKSA